MIYQKGLLSTYIIAQRFLRGKLLGKFYLVDYMYAYKYTYAYNWIKEGGTR
jgi:hypothetical protein